MSLVYAVSLHARSISHSIIDPSPTAPPRPLPTHKPVETSLPVRPTSAPDSDAYPSYPPDSYTLDHTARSTVCSNGVGTAMEFGNISNHFCLSHPPSHGTHSPNLGVMPINHWVAPHKRWPPSVCEIKKAQILSMRIRSPCAHKYTLYIIPLL